MYYVLLAVLVGVLGILPLLCFKNFAKAGWVGGIGTAASAIVFYADTPSTAYPLWGLVGFMVVLLWFVCYAVHISGKYPDERGNMYLFPLISASILLLSGLSSCGIFRAYDYASLSGKVEERTWTQDVQPKDPHHMCMVSAENAMYTAKKAVAQGGTMSQYSLDEKAMTLQRVKEHLVYVIPFDYTELLAWWNSEGVPGFIIVDAEDPEAKPRFVELPKDQLMRYTPGAYFAYDLERHMRENGFMGEILTDPRFELDEQEHPWWIVTTSQPTVGWSGEKNTGVATVDPASGNIVRYSIDKAPEWIDRIYTSDLVKSYFEWRGVYSGGWVNSWSGKKNLTKPEDPILVYGADDRAKWVTSITSSNGKDDSLVGLMYTDSRTGESVFYKVGGGGTDSAILRAVDTNQQVHFKNLHAAAPQIYNIDGTMAAVMPLLNASHAFQGVAIVEVANVQDVAVGATQNDALHEYQKILLRRNQQMQFDKAPSVNKLEGVVDRIRQDGASQNGGYYLHIEGVPFIFTGSSQDYVKLELTQQGDKVKIEYVATAGDVLPMKKFENASPDED